MPAVQQGDRITPANVRRTRRTRVFSTDIHTNIPAGKLPPPGCFFYVELSQLSASAAAPAHAAGAHTAASHTAAHARAGTAGGGDG